jgi:hypothetical protein
MKDIEKRKYEMFLRVREFGAGRAAEFPPSTLAGELFNVINGVVGELEAHATAQASGKGAAQESTASKAAARDELRRDLEAITRTARVMALTAPGLESKFRTPRSFSDQALLITARAFASDAQPLKTDFTRRGLPEDFLEDLAGDIEEFEQAVAQTMQRRGTHVAATAAIDAAIERGVNTARELDVIMRNKFAADPPALAAWLSASHTQRTPRREPASPPDTQQPAPAP